MRRKDETSVSGHFLRRTFNLFCTAPRNAQRSSDVVGKLQLCSTLMFASDAPITFLCGICAAYEPVAVCLVFVDRAHLVIYHGSAATAKELAGWPRSDGRSKSDIGGERAARCQRFTFSSC